MPWPLPLLAALTPEAEVRRGRRRRWLCWTARRREVGVSPASLQVRPIPSGMLGGSGEGSEGLERTSWPRDFLPAVRPGLGAGTAQLRCATELPLSRLSRSGTPCLGRQDCHPLTAREITKYSPGPAAKEWCTSWPQHSSPSGFVGLPYLFYAG